MSKAIVASAPGKVLITGGYLVLDQEYSGCVLSVDSRFHVTVSSASSNDSSNSTVTVFSPQFTDPESVYSIQIDDNGCSLNLLSGNPNKFVEITLKNTLAFAAFSGEGEKKEFKSLKILIQADNDFYSQREQLSKLGLEPLTRNLAQLPKYAPTGLPLSQVKKTGLGSSAALVTSLVASLLVHFKVISDECSAKDLEIVHNLSQYCHCLAQGKIGSGFDVASAVYGSQIYRRFDPSPMASLMNSADADWKKLYESLGAGSQIAKTIPPNSQFKLPAGLYLMLADVDAGSNTPKLVSSVLAWKRDNPAEAKELWQELDRQNSKVVNGMNQLNKLSEIDSTFQDKVKAWTSDHTSHSNSLVTNALDEISAAFTEIRRLFRYLSNKCGAPIEPPEQTRLLDACMKVPGVLIAGVPGGIM